MRIEEYALTFLHQPYRWGGSNPLTGFDCSGFVLELLKAYGAAPFKDGSAQDLYSFFLSIASTSKVPTAGSFCFYGKDTYSISHIAMMINPVQIIEAGGGDHTTTSLDRAKEQGACIRLRHYKHRNDLVDIVTPDSDKWGQILV